MIRATRTVNPLHFEDLEPHRFEDLIRQLAYNFRNWRYLDATGRLGADGGLDVRGLEIVGWTQETDGDPDDTDDDTASTPRESRPWSIQCKRYKEIGPTLMRKIVDETVPEGSDPPYGLIVAAACDVSEKTMAAFREQTYSRGVAETHLWTKAYLEDLLFQPDNDHLLFAYFGVSLRVRRHSALQDVRRLISVKRKLMRAFKADEIEQPLSRDALIRDLFDKMYPDEAEGMADRGAPSWEAVTVESFSYGGVIVCCRRYLGRVTDEGKWDILSASAECPVINRGWRQLGHEQQGVRWDQTEDFTAIPEKERYLIRELRGIRYDAILEVDPIGDELHPYPHIFCEYLDSGPYIDAVWYLASPHYTSGLSLHVDRELDVDDRERMFIGLPGGRSRKYKAPE